jgi:hypothetical protein
MLQEQSVNVATNGSMVDGRPFLRTDAMMVEAYVIRLSYHAQHIQLCEPPRSYMNYPEACTFSFGLIGSSVGDWSRTLY